MHLPWVQVARAREAPRRWMLLLLARAVRVARARAREAHRRWMRLSLAQVARVAGPPELAARRPCPQVPSARTTPNALSASVWMVFAATVDAADNANPAPKLAALGRARRFSRAIPVARARHAPVRTSARVSVMFPVRRPARCQATLRYAKPRVAQAVNIRPNRSVAAVVLAPPRPHRHAQLVRAPPTIAESASGPVRQLLAPQANTVPLRAIACRRRGTELETRARRGPSVCRPTAHPSTAFAAIRTARDNARLAATARERALESPRVSPWEAVPRARAQPMPLVAGVAITRLTIAISHPREPHAWQQLARIRRRTNSPRPAPGVGMLARLPTPRRRPVHTAVATGHAHPVI